MAWRGPFGRICESRGYARYATLGFSMLASPIQPKTVVATVFFWIFICVLFAAAWVGFIFWFIGYKTVKQYKASVTACRNATSEDHYCPPTDAPVLNGEAFTKTLQEDMYRYTQDQIRRATEAAASSTWEK